MLAVGKTITAEAVWLIPNKTLEWLSDKMVVLGDGGIAYRKQSKDR